MSVTSGSFTSYSKKSDEAYSGVSNGTAFFNYYPIMTRIVLTTAITAGADFNYYAAV